MDNHFKNGINLATDNTFKVTGLPEGMSFEDLDINFQRYIMSQFRFLQIEKLQGNKVALYCMGKISLYNTYEEANAVKETMTFLDSQIFLPPGMKTPEPTEDLLVMGIRRLEIGDDNESRECHESHECQCGDHDC